MRVGVIILIPVAAATATCGADERKAPVVRGKSVERAMMVTIDAGGARLASTTTGAVPSRCTGMIDGRRSTDVRCTGRLHLRGIAIRGDLYLDMPELSRRGYKKWVTADRSNDFSWSMLTPGYAPDPLAVARVVARAGPEEAGTEEIGGVPTSHYAATVDKREIQKLGLDNEGVRGGFVALRIDHEDAPRVEVWIDRDNLIRRTRARVRVKILTDVVSDDPPATRLSDQIVELFDFGPRPRIKPPPAAQTEKLR